LMAIPNTVLMVAFNAMVATIVPPEFRPQVVGRRNALFAATIMLSFLVSGAILDRLSFAWGYVVVFGLGAIGAALSTYNVVCLQMPDTVPQFKGRLLNDYGQPGRVPALSGGVPQRLTVGLRMLLQWRPDAATLREVSGPYWWTMWAFFLFHFSQMLPAAIIPQFWVRELHLTDGEIGWVNAVFYLTMLVGSLFLEPLSKRLGNYVLTMWGAILLALAPLLTALSHDMTLLLVANIAGGSVWAILSGAMFNRLLDLIPEDKRPVHLALYNMALNVAVLVGTMSGSFLADIVGLREILFVIAALRVLSGLALGRWG
jgi:MFS family permease